MHFKSLLMILCLTSSSILSAPVGNSLDRRRLQNRSLLKGIFMGLAKFFIKKNQQTDKENESTTMGVTNTMKISASQPLPVFPTRPKRPPGVRIPSPRVSTPPPWIKTPPPPLSAPPPPRIN